MFYFVFEADQWDALLLVQPGSCSSKRPIIARTEPLEFCEVDASDFRIAI